MVGTWGAPLRLEAHAIYEQLGSIRLPPSPLQYEFLSEGALFVIELIV